MNFLRMCLRKKKASPSRRHPRDPTKNPFSREYICTSCTTYTFKKISIPSSCKSLVLPCIDRDMEWLMSQWCTLKYNEQTLLSSWKNRFRLRVVSDLNPITVHNVTQEIKDASEDWGSKNGYPGTVFHIWHTVSFQFKNIYIASLARTMLKYFLTLAAILSALVPFAKTQSFDHGKIVGCYFRSWAAEV